MQATETGKVYLQYAYKIRSLSKEMDAKVLAAAEHTPQLFTIGIVHGGDLIPFLNVKMLFEKKYPSCKVRFVNINYCDYDECLKKRNYDFFIGPKGDFTKFTSKLLTEEEILLAISNLCLSKPEFYGMLQSDSQHTWVDFRDTKDLPLLVQEKYCRITEKMSWLFDTYPKAFKTISTVINSSLALDAVKSGMGAAFVLNSYNRPADMDGLHFYPVLNPPVKLEVYLNWKNQRILTFYDTELIHLFENAFDI